MKVSVITYVYCTKKNGRLKLLKEAIESVANQGFDSYEHIIVDDGSTVPLKPLLEQYKNISYYRKKNTGITQSTMTFNYGFKVAKGEYCIILPSDDLQVNGSLAGLSKYLDNHPKVGMAIGNAIYETMKGNTRKWTYRADKPPYEALMERNVVNACAVMFRTSLLKKIQLPSDQAGFAADYDLWIRLSEVGKWGIAPVDVVRYRHVADSTRNKTRKDRQYRSRCLFFVHSEMRKRRGIPEPKGADKPYARKVVRNSVGAKRPPKPKTAIPKTTPRPIVNSQPVVRKGRGRPRGKMRRR